MQESETITAERGNGPPKDKKSDGEQKEKSIYKGVFRCGKKFKAQIQTNRVQHYLGLYDTEIEAAQAYDNHARVVLGPRARTNFDYTNVPQTGPTVQVAPIFTRADPKPSQPTGEGGEEPHQAPKRTYVGIKLKRQAMNGISGLHRADDHEKRQKTESFDHGTLYGQNPSASGLPGYPSFLSTSAGHTGFPRRDFGSMSPHLGASAGFPGVSNPALLMPPVPAADASPDEQRRFFEQYRLLQQLMQAQAAAPYFLNHSQQQHPASQGLAGGAAGAYNPYMMSVPFSGGMSQDSSPFGMMHVGGKYPGMPYDPYAAQQFTHYPNMAGYFPAHEGGGQYPAHPSGPVDLSGLLLSASAHIAGGASSAGAGRLSASAAALAATMSQATSETSSSGQEGQAGRDRSRVGTANSSASSDRSGNLLTLSEAVSSLPNSSASSPQGFDASYIPHSRSMSGAVNSTGGGGGAAALVSPTNDRTSQLLAAAAAMMGGSGVNTPRSPAGRTRNEDDEEEDEAESDWRDQLYYWTGELQFDAARLQQVWKGSWVGSYTGKPKPAEFAQSSNHFEYRMNVRSAEQVLRRDGSIAPQSGSWEGFYLMDNTGNGALERYEDTEYEVRFEEIQGSGEGRQGGSMGGVEAYCPVYGRGDSDFGAFVVTGVYNRHSRRLEMTRQYVADADPRAAMTLDAFIAHCRTTMPPWR